MQPQQRAHAQDLIARLLERKPARRLGMLAGKAADVRRHKWFDAIDWDALGARRVEPPRKPRDDSAKRLKELQARRACLLGAHGVQSKSAASFSNCNRPADDAAMTCHISLLERVLAGPPWPFHLLKLCQLTAQENEKKQKREPKETAEELQECEMVFADF